MHNASFIRELERKVRTLEAHGLGPNPDTSELAGKICDLEDEVDALARFFGVKAAKDHRGRWRVATRRKGGE